MNQTASQLPDPATVPNFRPGGISPSDTILAAAPVRVRRRVQWLADRVETLDASIEGAHHEVSHAGDAWEVAKTNSARLEQQSVLPNSGVTEAMVEAAKRKVAAASDRRDRAMQRHRDLVREREALRVMLGAAQALIAQRRVAAQEGPGRLAGDDHEPAPLDLEEVEVDAPSTAEGCRATIAEVAREIAEHLAAREEIEQAPVPAQFAKDSIRLKIERLAQAGRLGVTTPSATEEVAITWPMKTLNAAGRASHPGERPQIIDVEAVLCKLHGDEIIEEAERAIDAAYAAVALTLEPHERRRRLREIDQRILDLQRRECAARWALIERHGDEDIGFRPGTSAAAILGVA